MNTDIDLPLNGIEMELKAKDEKLGRKGILGRAGPGAGARTGARTGDGVQGDSPAPADPHRLTFPKYLSYKIGIEHVNIIFPEH